MNTKKNIYIKNKTHSIYILTKNINTDNFFFLFLSLKITDNDELSKKKKLNKKLLNILL